MSEPVQIALAIIVNHERTYTLVGIRPDGVHLAGMAEFPGGKVEMSETPKQCAIREAKEETGLDVEIIEAWKPIEFTYPERVVILHPFLGSARSDQSLIVPWKWAEIKTLDETMFPAANKALIERLLEL